MGARIVEASRTTIRTLYERVQKRWAILWTAAETALAAKLGALKETWGERMRALEKTLADRRRTFMQRWVRSVGPRNPRRPARATKVDPRQERLTEIRPHDLADLAAELAAVKADVAKHKEVIDDLTRKLAEAQGRSNQPASPPLGPGIAPPSPKPPVSTKRNGHGEAKYHRS